MWLLCSILLLAQVGEPSIDDLLGEKPDANPAVTAAAETQAAPSVTPDVAKNETAPTEVAKSAPPAESADTEATAEASAESNWLSDLMNTGALGYTCNGCATSPDVCGGPYEGGTKGEECTYADTMNPVLAMCYSMAYCAPTDPRICPE